MKRWIWSGLVVALLSIAVLGKATGPLSSMYWDETLATLTLGNSTQVVTLKFPTSEIVSETGELMIHADGSEGILLVSSSYGDIHINVTGGPLFAAYGPGSYQDGDFFNFNRRMRIDEANSDNELSAQLNVVSTTRGFLSPRMTTTQKNAISSPAEGLEVYDLTLHKKCVYTGSAWETITSS